MNTKDTNPIDNLFRDTLSDFTVPTNASPSTLVKTALKKNSFFAFSFTRFNIYYTTIIALGIIAFVSLNTKNDSNKIIVENSTTIAKEVKLENTSTFEQQNNEQGKTIIQKNSISIISNTPKNELNIQKQDLKQITHSPNVNIVEAEELVENSIKSDIEINNVIIIDSTFTHKTPKTVVYIKPAPIEIIDTVIQVVKRKRKK